MREGSRPTMADVSLSSLEPGGRTVRSNYSGPVDWTMRGGRSTDFTRRSKGADVFGICFVATPSDKPSGLVLVWDGTLGCPSKGKLGAPNCPTPTGATVEGTES